MWYFLPRKTSILKKKKKQPNHDVIKYNENTLLQTTHLVLF